MYSALKLESPSLRVMFCNYNKLNNKLKQVTWHEVYTADSIDAANNAFLLIFMQCHHESLFPIKHKHKENKPWNKNNLINLRHIKSSMFRQYKRDLIDNNQFKQFRNFYGKQIKKAKIVHYSNLIGNN